jgi:dihydrofolate reductase
MRISLIAAMARNRVIGRDNQLPWRLPEDLKRFKALTMGHPVVMGRKTYESIGKPLPGRLNLVLTRGPWSGPAGTDGPVPVVSLDQAIERARATGTDEIFVIGGGQVYELAMPLADRLYLTLVDGEHAGDAYFPQWDEASFREIERDERQGFSFVTLDREKKI